MMEPHLLADALIVFAILTAAGLVKGVAGFGLPTVSLSLLALTRPLPEAMALILLPTLATNVVQAFAGPALRAATLRLWSFLLVAAIACWFGTGILARSDARVLTGILGVVLVAASAIALATPRMPAPTARQEAWLSPVMGGVSGLLAGMTGSFLVPAAPWFQAIRLTREEFVQGFGIGVVLVTTVLAIGMRGEGLLPAELGLASVGALVPAFLGMEIGRRLRLRLNEQRFRQAVQVALGLLGLFLAWRGLR